MKNDDDDDEDLNDGTKWIIINSLLICKKYKRNQG